MVTTGSALVLEGPPVGSMVPDEIRTLVGEVNECKTLPEDEYKQRLGSMVPGLVATDTAGNLDINARKVKDVKFTNLSLLADLHQVLKSPSVDIKEEVDAKFQRKAAVPPLDGEDDLLVDDALYGDQQAGETKGTKVVAVGHIETEQVMSVSIVRSESGSVNISYDGISRRSLPTECNSTRDELLVDHQDDGHHHDHQVMSEDKFPTEAGISSFRLVDIFPSEVI